MKILLLGATGRVGKEILKHILHDDHDVTILVRDPNKIHLNEPKVTMIHGNVLDSTSIQSAVKGCHIVISALGTDGNNTLSQCMPLIIKAMDKEQIHRIITIGTAGILQSHLNPDIYRFQSSESRRKSTYAAEDHLKAYLALKESDLNWTTVCPTFLPIGERRGIYRVERDFLPENGAEISIYDTADFAYSQISTDEFARTRVGICY